LDLDPHLESPEQLERLYAEQPDAFARALTQLEAHRAEHLLVRAWRLRLRAAARTTRDSDAEVNWRLVVTLALAAACVMRLLLIGAGPGDPTPVLRFGAFVVLVPVAIVLCYARPRPPALRHGLLGLGALLALPVAIWAPLASAQSGVLSLAHLPVWLGALVFGLFARGGVEPLDGRAEFVAIAVEVAIFSAALAFAGGLLAGMTLGVFQLIGIDLGPLYAKNVILPGCAAIPVLAAGLERSRASRNERIGPALARIFSPLVLLTLLAYALAVVGSQRSPYRDRDSLALLYAMLLATGVLVTVTVLQPRDNPLSRRFAAMTSAICGLAVAVDAIALSAIVYRFAAYGLSPNRVAVLGGNVLLFAYLLGLTVALARASRSGDTRPAQHWIAGFIPCFGVWAGLWVFVLPALFGYR
jgi:hypothetical protein